MSKMFVYVWTDACNTDYSGGDVVVVAHDLEQAMHLLLKPSDECCNHQLDINTSTPPDYVFPLGAEGFCWYGPGGA